MKYEQVMTAIKDAGFLGVSFGGIIYQQATGNVNPYLLGVYLALLLPVAVPAVQRVRQGSTPDTTGPSSLPAPEPPPQPEPSSSAQ